MEAGAEIYLLDAYSTDRGHTVRHPHSLLGFRKQDIIPCTVTTCLQINKQKSSFLPPYAFDQLELQTLALAFPSFIGESLSLVYPEVVVSAIVDGKC